MSDTTPIIEPEHMTNVMLTVDTEFWPDRWNLQHDNVKNAYKRDILGEIDNGKEYGLPMLCNILNKYELQAVFFVEPLSSSELGDEYLQHTIQQLQDCDQEIQLHLHPEWWTKKHLQHKLARRQFMHQFSRNQQEDMLHDGLEALARCGASNINAFRAGNYGADNNTLRALATHNIAYDSSYNLPYLDGNCRIESHKPLYDVTPIDGVIEYPISCFEDWPGHIRHAQLCATSFEELSNLLMQAWHKRFTSFTIVLHSFELLCSNRQRPDPITIKRMNSLCQFLHEHSNLFKTVGFHKLSESKLPENRKKSKLQSEFPRTLRRIKEQATRRIRAALHRHRGASSYRRERYNHS